jgi:hypothetical protein
VAERIDASNQITCRSSVYGRISFTKAVSIAPGTRLGPYEIVAPLGSGGMGEVYRAHDTRLKRPVAVKVLPSALSADPDRLRRFELEAQATGQLNHPNILAIYDVGTHEGAPYVVSELLEGETLRETLPDGPLPTRRALEYARGIATGLAAAHEKGIVHRDLKPENVFVTSDGRVKILDFGLAKLTQPERPDDHSAVTTTPQGTEPGIVMGTAGYMSPEQVRGGPIDHRSDLFSFGAVLYEMLSGRRPFRGDSPIETMNAILKEEPPELGGSGRNVPPDLDRIVRHCLEKNPSRRFQSARDLAFGLESLSEATSAPVPAVGGRTKRPRFYLAAATLLALAAATLAYIAGRGVRSAPPPRFQRVTFRAGTPFTARFAPDGQTIVYGAAWEGQPYHLFSTLPGSAESRPLGLPPALVTSISKRGEMAIVLGPAGPNLLGTLARVPLAGGAPRPVLEGVRNASWAPDDEMLAVSMTGGVLREKIEYPVGKVVYQTTGFIYDMRLSPDGNYIAIEETRPLTFQGGVGWIGLIDRSGERTTLHEGWVRNCGVAWLPGGREFVFAIPDSSGSYREIYAASVTGKKRLLARFPGAMTMHDVSRDGRLLFSRDEVRILTLGGFEGGRTERMISWLDESMAADLSVDGRYVLLSEIGGGGGAKGAVYLRPTDGGDAIRLGDGQALALSPDGNWALATTAEPAQLVLLPTGVGQRKTVAISGGAAIADFESYQFARFLPDGRRIFFNANVRGRVNRCYVVDLEGGASRPFGAEGASCWASSPDGRWLAVTGPDRALSLHPVDGTGAPRPVAGWTKGATLLQWSADGRSLYVTIETDIPMSIRKLDLQTGRSELVKKLVPPDTAGVQTIAAPLVTRDGHTYAYTYMRLLGDLYVADGLK